MRNIVTYISALPSKHYVAMMQLYLLHWRNDIFEWQTHCGDENECYL